MRRRFWLFGTALAMTLGGAMGAAPALAQKSADTLRVTWRDTIPNVDPYYNQLRNGLVLAHHVWDGLLHRDPETFQIKPLLAKSFRWVDETTLEFELRPNVKFHNGDALSADDVVYTINAVVEDKKVSVPSNYAFIAGAERVDDLRVRIKLKRVFPAALEYLAMVTPIWPKAYRERVGPETYAKQPVGAGPYRLVQVDASNVIHLERFDGYYADSPKGRPAIGKIQIRQVADASTELNELIGGRADWIWKYNADQFDNINRLPNLMAQRAESMRVGYVNMDAAGRTGAGNPFTNVKVRQAVFHAVDRAAMAKNLVQGGSRVPDAPCFPTQFGCDGTAAVKYDYNPEKARKLLAEAGFPNGFDTELVTYELPQWSGALQGYLHAVGIRAKITQITVSAFVTRSLKGENPMELGGWGSYSINDASAILPQYFTGGGNDYARDAEVKAAVEAGGTTTDADQRRKHYSQAIRLVTERAYWLPMFTHSITYGHVRTLNFKPYPDELPRFYLASWK
jgi:peptide/nickel transport system substrate-binding protein